MSRLNSFLRSLKGDKESANQSEYEHDQLGEVRDLTQ